MNVILHQIAWRDDGTMELLVSFGNDPLRVFLAAYDVVPKYRCCSVDDELFMRLSDLAHRRYGNCIVYQMELTGIVDAFATGKQLPPLPATLGTTSFCTVKPGALRVAWNKFWILLYRVGLWRPRVWVHPDYQNLSETADGDFG